MQPLLLAKGAQLCIDLRMFRDTAPNILKSWRAAYVKGIGDGTLLFATPGGMVLREKNEETASPLRLDPAWTRKAELYTPDELRGLIDGENRNAFDILVAQLRSPVGVVPFVGAGLSVPFGFPGWPKFLKDAAAYHSAPEEVLRLVKRNRLIEAAQLLYKPNPDRFQRLVEKWFGAPIADEQVREGPLSLLPLICRGPSITTNFDRVLEAAFRAAKSSFDRPITALEPDNVIRAMHRNEHVLIKMHGDALDRSARVFTGVEYERQYGSGKGSRKGRRRGRIPMLARIMFTNRPLLFLGCSLDKDQTLEVLGELHHEVPGVTHYAVLSADYSISKHRGRRDELGRYGINPLWFVPGEFGQIEIILEELLHETSTRLIWKGSKSATAAPEDAQTTPAPSLPAGGHAISGRDGQNDRLTRRIAQRLARGEVAFLLGAGIHLGLMPSARDFYSSLSKDYGFSEDDAQRAEVAQYLIDREGKPQAWAAAKQKLRAVGTQPSAVCEFLADLPALLRRLGKREAANQWLMTTNLDVVLEGALTARGEPFHLLSQQVDGEHEGRFAHQDLTGSIRIVERPENIRRMGSASVIVKLDGGISWNPNLPETVAMSPLDFSMSAGRMLTALPEAVRHVLRSRSLLVLGSSLRDAHTQRLVRWSAGSSRVVKTWAVMKPVSVTSAQYWPAAGVELLECDLTDFVGELRRELES